MGILHKNIRQKARGGLQAYSLCSLRGPLTTKNLHLNFNYTWISIMIGAPTGRTLFSSLRSNRQERPTKSPLKMVIPAKRWPKMAPNIGMLHRNPRQKGLGGQRAIASLLYRPSALPGLFAVGFGNISLYFSGLVPIWPKPWSYENTKIIKTVKLPTELHKKTVSSGLFIPPHKTVREGPIPPRKNRGGMTIPPCKNREGMIIPSRFLRGGMTFLSRLLNNQAKYSERWEKHGYS